MLRIWIRIRIHRNHMLLDLLVPDPDSLVRNMDPDPDPDSALDPKTSIIQKSKKNLNSYYSVTPFDLLSLKMMYMYFKKVISRKYCVRNISFCFILKVDDVNIRIRIQDPDSDPHPLVRGIDPRIRIRIRGSGSESGSESGSTQICHRSATLVDSLRFMPLTFWNSF